MEDWANRTLGEIAEITMGQSPDSKYYSEDEIGMRFLQGCAEFGDRYPSSKLFCSQPKKIAKAGSILFSVRAPVGRTNVADQDYIIGRGLASISAKHIDHGYLEQYLKFSEERFRNISQGSTFEAINSTELGGSIVSYSADPIEQIQIAAILSTSDKAIEQTEAIIAKQQRIKTGLMQDLLTRGIDEHGNMRSEETHDFKDSPLGKIPVEWEVSSLKSKGHPSRAHIKTGPFGSALKSEHWVEHGIPVITIGALGEGQFISSNLLFVSGKTAQRLAPYALVEGDIVFSRVADVGRSVVMSAGGNRLDHVLKFNENQP